MNRLFAIADLHLSLARPKPMDIFGPGWQDHVRRVARHWDAAVLPGDLVLIAGDISWAMKLDEARPDLEWIAARPGRKVLIKGNHDYWWSSIRQVRQAAPAGLYFVQNDVADFDDVVIGGTRLWDFPGINWPLPAAEAMAGAAVETIEDKARAEVDDERIRRREIQRLKNSLAQLPRDGRRRVAMVHYPPVGADGQPTALTDIINSYDIDLCVYGHVHALGDEPRPGADCVIGGTRFVLTACDWLGCRLRLLDDPAAPSFD
ncbi:MAG: metallophosphoesterase [Acidobacteria bacterium]|nr:metallophosphoesterase [Acidobacteriota bacterium]